jgi:hypothetical protein
MQAPELNKFLYIVDACFETEDLFDYIFYFFFELE